MSEIYKIIDNKVILHSEIVVCLFEHCNLTCSFCPQDHNSIIGADRESILKKADLIVEYITNNKRSTDFKIHVMGGELFQDRWIENGFLTFYSEFISDIRSRVPKDKYPDFNFITNLVFDKWEEVYEFLEKNDIRFSISYDSKGRFNKEQFGLFKRNVERFKQKIRMVSCVATTQNIKSLISGEDKYFSYLYSLFPCDWDSLIPAVKGAEHMMPSESLLLKFYKHLVNNYPECINISYFTEEQNHNRMSCTRGNSFTILPDNSSPKGCSGVLYLKDPTSNDLFSGSIVEKFLQNYNCFECEFFKKCPFTCFIKNDYSKIKRDLGQCVFKETFKYVESKNEIS